LKHQGHKADEAETQNMLGISQRMGVILNLHREPHIVLASWAVVLLVKLMIWD